MVTRPSLSNLQSSRSNTTLSVGTGTTRSDGQIDGTVTPSEPDTENVGVTRSSSDLALLAQWEEAQEQCKLRKNEMHEIRNFKTPQQLLDSLHVMAEQYSEHPLRRMITRIKPCLEILGSFHGLLATSFAIATLPQGPFENTILWGLLHLSIKKAIASQGALKATVDILGKIQTELRVFTVVSRGVENIREIRHEIVDMLVALIQFWHKAAQMFRGIKKDASGDQMPYDDLNEDFQGTLKSLRDSLTVVERLSADAIQSQYFKKRPIPGARRTEVDEEASQASFPCFAGIARKNPYFRCRADELFAIERFFAEHAASDGLHCCVIYGFGGVGKSALAHAFVERCMERNQYDAVFWVRSQTKAELMESFTEIERVLKLPTTTASEQSERVQRAKDWLNKTDKTWLCVFDNVDDMQMLENNNFMPYSGHVIVTTRYKQEAFKAPGISCQQELDVLAEEDALVVFNSLGSRYGFKPKDRDQDEQSVRVLLRKLHGHALGIEQMVAYIAFKEMSPNEFLHEYEKKSRKIHGYDGTNKAISKFNLATLWDMHFEELSKSDEGQSALLLLGLLSLLAPDAIQSELLSTDGAIDVDVEYEGICGDEDNEGFDIAKDLLVKHALVKEQGDMLSLHRLIQTAFDFSKYGFARKGRQNAFHTVGKLLNARFPKMGGSVSLHSRWKHCSQLVPHCQSLRETYLRYRGTKSCLLSSGELDELFKNVAWYLVESGEHNESLKMVEVAQEMCLDKKGLLYAQLCNNAGCIHFELNSGSAEESFNECKKIRIAKLDDDHAELANVYNNLALYYTSVGKIDEAYTLMKRRLEMAINDPETEAAYLGFAHLGLGRIHFLRAKEGDDATAMKHFEIARALWAPLGNSANWMMVHYHFDLGNYNLFHRKTQLAKASFDAGGAICAQKPKTMMNISFLYKIALTQSLLGAQDKEALNNLTEAISIAKALDLPGHEARLSRLKAFILQKERPLSEAGAKEASALNMRAQALKMSLKQEGRAPGVSNTMAEEEQYDRLVSILFR